MVILSASGQMEARPSRLLIIDDEPAIRIAIKRFLSRRGWEVEEAGDGNAALERLLQSEPGEYDVVICDLRMPHCSGEDLHRVLLEKRPDLVDRLVFSTGDVSSADAAAFLAATARPVIEKPFELARLQETVDRIRDQVHPVKDA